METIRQLRKRIDEVDEEILQFIHERVDICKSIGLVKEKYKIPVQDSPRENDVYSHIKEKSSALGLDSSCVKEIYNIIVKMCSVVQNSKPKDGKETAVEN